MAITLSTIKKWAISRDNGATWLYFPKQPNAFPSPTPSVEVNRRVVGTEQVPIYHDLELHFDVVRGDWWRDLAALYDSSNQEILLNYLSVAHDLDGAGDVIPRWYYAPAIWSRFPSGERGPNMTWRNVIVKIGLVEWWLPGMDLSTENTDPDTGGGGSTSGGPTPVNLRCTSFTTTSFVAYFGVASVAQGYTTNVYVDGALADSGVIPLWPEGTSIAVTGLTSGSTHSVYITISKDGYTSDPSNTVSVTIN